MTGATAEGLLGADARDVAGVDVCSGPGRGKSASGDHGYGAVVAHETVERRIENHTAG
jgi:hypothetical protein